MKYLALFLTTFISTSPFASEQEQQDECHSLPVSDRVIDSVYSRVNTRFCQPAVWFDSFFVDERIDQDSRAGSIVRWTNDFTYVEGTGYEFQTRLKARLHLPKVNKRLKLIFETDEEDDVFELFPKSSDDVESTLGLRYDWIDRDRASFNIKLTAKPGIEGRFRYTYPVNEDLVVRLTQKVYQKKRLTGESTDIDMDYSFNQDFLLRWNNFAKYEDDIKGWEYGTGLSLYQYLSETQAITYQASVAATNRPYDYVSNSHLSVTYRQNIFRSWLFYELKPEYNWPREENEQREREARATLRLEILFQNI
ncbi:hypothetical protein [Vibrio maerlii]|uniref:hypothetical protein n=1 Tax=Vibrio maerlii TaxID=2231648 RepID=UPI000E3EADC3|nr:hypothetical protein [Vibrio maerlii]